MIVSRDKVELALRSANAAKRALELMDANSVIVAKSYVADSSARQIVRVNVGEPLAGVFAKLHRVLLESLRL